MKNTIAIVAGVVMSTVLLGGVFVSADEVMFSAQEVDQIVSAVKSENYTLLDTGAKAKVSTEQFTKRMKIAAVRKEARDQINTVKQGAKSELSGKKLEMKETMKQNREKVKAAKKQMGTGVLASGQKMELKEMREQNKAEMSGKKEEIKKIWSGAKTEIKQVKEERKEEVQKIKEEDKAQRTAVEKAISENNYEAFKLAASTDMLAKVNSAEKFAMLVELYKKNKKGPKPEGSDDDDHLPLPPVANSGSTTSGVVLPIV